MCQIIPTIILQFDDKSYNNVTFIDKKISICYYLCVYYYICKELMKHDKFR